MTTSAALTADELDAVVLLLDDITAAWTDANAQTGGNWPEGACVETAIGIRDEMREKLPATLPAYVWGALVINGFSLGHAWVALRDGTIVDGTLGQFLNAGTAWSVIPPGHPLAGYYDEHERPSGV
jgi:hypothetical protein